MMWTIVSEILISNLEFIKYSIQYFSELTKNYHQYTKLKFYKAANYAIMIAYSIYDKRYNTILVCEENICLRSLPLLEKKKTLIGNCQMHAISETMIHHVKQLT